MKYLCQVWFDGTRLDAMAKLRVDNKLAAIQRACWFGLI